MPHRRPGRRPSPFLVAVASAALGAITVALAAAPAEGSARASVQLPAAVTAPPSGFLVTASTAVLNGLAYAGLVSVPTSGGGSVTAMDLTASSATLTDLSVVVPCTPVPGLGVGMTSVSGIAPGAKASASAGMHLYATSLTAAGGVAWSPASPPPAASLGDVTVTSVTIDAVWMSLPALSAPGLAQRTAFCTA